MGWNAKEAALACGLPSQSWRNWEKGIRPHNYEEVCRLIIARTECDAEWLFGIAAPNAATDDTHRGTTGRKSADSRPAFEPVAA